MDRQTLEWSVALAGYHLETCDWCLIGVDPLHHCSCGLTKWVGKLLEEGRLGAIDEALKILDDACGISDTSLKWYEDVGWAKRRIANLRR